MQISAVIFMDTLTFQGKPATAVNWKMPLRISSCVVSDSRFSGSRKHQRSPLQ